MNDAVDVLVLGELNPDVLVYGVRPPVSFGQVETQVTGAEIRLGSSGAITAAACRTAGLSAAICGVVGDDLVGTITRGLLADTGVDTTGVLMRDDIATGMTIVLNDASGDRALLTHPGAMAALRIADVPVELLARARHVHVSSLFLQHGLHDGLPELFAGLQARGISTSLDTGWDPADAWSGVRELLPHLSYLFPNEAELVKLAGALGLDLGLRDGPSRLPELARELAATGPVVAVKCGAHGALLVDGEHGWQTTGTPLVPLDTTGAGDNFNAGFLFAMTTGAGTRAALATAAAAGAIAVTGRGGTGRMATSGELAAARDSPQLRSLW